MWENVLKTAISVVVTFLLTLFLNGIINLPKKKKKMEEEVKQAEAKKQKHLDDKLDSIRKDIALCMRANQVTLKNDLKVRYDHWIDLGYAPEDAKDDLEKEYQVYHSLGKNGVMDSRRARFLALPNEAPERHN